MVSVCIAGATGWTGRALVGGVLAVRAAVGRVGVTRGLDTLLAGA